MNEGVVPPRCLILKVEKPIIQNGENIRASDRTCHGRGAGCSRGQRPTSDPSTYLTCLFRPPAHIIPAPHSSPPVVRCHVEVYLRSCCVSRGLGVGL